MTHETSLLLMQSGWLYVGLAAAVLFIFCLGWRYGQIVRRKQNKESAEFSSIFITSIFGFFAILVAFQLSGSAQIYETQRKLTMDEIISILGVIDAASLLRVEDRADVQKLLVGYVEQRETFYNKPIHPSGLETRGREQKDLGMGLVRHAFMLLPKYVGDDRVMFMSFLSRVQLMNTGFEQQYASIFMQMPSILWQALITLLMIISAICGYKTGIEKGQQFGLTAVFLVVVLAAIIICLNLGNPRVSALELDLFDAHFPKLLSRIGAIQ
jgi:hypothetical protein